MKFIARLIAFVAVALVATGISPAAAQTEPVPPPAYAGPLTGEFVDGELVVGFTAQATDAQIARALSRSDVGAAGDVGAMNAQIVRLDAGQTMSGAIESLRHQPGVRFVEPNYVWRRSVTPNDTSFGQLWGLHNTGQTVNGTTGTADADIDAPEAWNISTGSTSVVVAVADTGIDYDHPDLAGNLWTNPGETGGGKETNGLDDDGNGFIDDWRGWDFVSGDNDPKDYDLFVSHGTHVAGTIGARGNNALGVTGVNWQVSLVGLRVFNAEGSGTSANIAAAFNYAGDRGIKVVNFSGGGPALSAAVQTAIDNHPNTLYVVSAGNNNLNLDTTGNDAYPCEFPSANIICVAASDQNDAKASFSNFGSNVDIAAPGVNVLSLAVPTTAPYAETFSTDPFASRWTKGAAVGTNTWATEAAYSPTASAPSLTDGTPFLANYPANFDTWVQTTNPISLAGQTVCSLIVPGYIDIYGPDSDAFEISLANTPAMTLANIRRSWSGTGFIDDVHDLAQFVGGNVYVRLGLFSDTAANPSGFDGVYVDNIGIRCLSATYTGSEYRFLAGTSMAAPHVAGAAALMLAINPSLTTAQLKSRILSTGDSKAAFTSPVTSSGKRLNLFQAAISADTTAPAITITTPPNAAVYTQGQVVNANYSCSDTGGSGVATCTGPVANGAAIDTATTGPKTFTVNATDNAGNPATLTHNYTVNPAPDTTAPVITITTPSESAIYTQGQVVNANYSCTDTGGSGVATCAGPVANGAAIDTATTGPKTFTVNATDNAGNPATLTRNYSVVTAPPADTTAPVITITTPPAAAVYTQGQVVLANYGCTDTGGSGVATCAGPVANGAAIDTATPGVKTFTVNATDIAGNPATLTRTYTVNPAPDTTAPVITITTPAAAAVYTQGQVVLANYGCTDTGGSGVATCAGPVANGAAIDTATTGPKTFTVNATDNAGNPATLTRTYTVNAAPPPPPADNIAPTITITTPPDGAPYAFNQAVNADFGCTDTGGSGLATCVAVATRGGTATTVATATAPACAAQSGPRGLVRDAGSCSGGGNIMTCAQTGSCTVPVLNGGSIPTNQSGTWAFTVNSTDNAGNASTKTHTYTVGAPPDTSAPTITITTPPNGAVYTVGQQVPANYSCSDPSGVTSCRGFVPNGAPINTSVAASKTFTVFAVDAFGNESSLTTNYTVVPAPNTTPASGGFTSLSPTRLLDTRQSGTPGAGASLTVPVVGRAGVPAAATAVLVNLTATNAAAAGYITTWAAGDPRPLASSLNFAAGQTVANMVVAEVGTDGAIALWNSNDAPSMGSVDLVVDVLGYFIGDSSIGAVAPERLLDTRRSHKLQSSAATDVAVLGVAGVPTTGVGAVVLNITATNTEAAGYLTTWPAGEPRPLASSLNFGAGQTVANLVVAKVGSNGSVSIWNSNDSSAMRPVDVIVDIVGWLPTGADFGSLSPSRLLDTRQSAPLGAGQSLNLEVLGRGGVPATGVTAVVVNVTVTGAGSAGYLTTWPAGDQRPLASSLNFAPGSTVANLVVAKVGADGSISIWNSNDAAAMQGVNVIVDVVGYFTG